MIVKNCCVWWASHICIVNLCAQWKPSVYSLYVPTVPKQDTLVLIKFYISPWLALKWQQLHYVIYSAHMCVNRICWSQALMQCHTFTCGQDSFLLRFSFSPVFQESAVKATNQGQAKFRDLHTYVTSTIQISLSPSRITGLSHQSRQLLCGQRESNPGFQLVEL